MVEGSIRRLKIIIFTQNENRNCCHRLGEKLWSDSPLWIWWNVWNVVGTECEKMVLFCCLFNESCGR